jgi:MGT family glycosyltransferase
MAVGRKFALDELGALPKNFIVRGSVPQLELLPHVNAFISHGGMNSVSESAWFGVPLVLFPQVGDQMMIARRVAQLGAGVLLEGDRIDARTIRSATETILGEEKYRKASQTIGESLREAGGYARAVDEIEEFVRRG